MSRALKITLVALVVMLEFLFITTYSPYPHGMIADVSYRHTERLAAFQDYMAHHSADTKAALSRELTLMHQHEDWKVELALGLLLLTNVAAAYFFLRRRQRTEAA